MQRNETPICGLGAFRSLSMVAAVASGAVVSTSAGADYEVVAFGVAHYSDPGMCSATPTLNADNEAVAFRDAMYTYAGYTTRHAYLDEDVEHTDWIDAWYDEVPTTGTDWADVVFFSGHGGTPYCGAIVSNRYQNLIMGNDASCNVKLGSTNNQVKFASGGANSDANFLMMHASRSLDFCVADQGNMIYRIDEGDAGNQFVLINGFHNSPENETTNDEKLVNYVDAAETSGVGNRWGTLLSYQSGYAGVECTASNVTSSSYANAENLFFYGGLETLPSTGANHSQNWYFYDCDRVECIGDLTLCD